jgi:hypothetical protein
LPAGDHEVVVCRVAAFQNRSDTAEDVLTTAHLRALGLMT